MSATLTPIPFFTDDITLVPHSVSTGLSDKLSKPLTVSDFVTATGAQRVGLFNTDDHELLIQTILPDGREFFARGPEMFPVFH
ncbi:hypothetical protein [Marinobacter sp. ELB17]|uniref:hypothetical protein n=1 Tax=Marinobacter sp. ELB17 TaxID=270374 RepID=UPI0000F36A89|nr:hypothetical protein [Marinobacter sp. ELB17]EAZ97464.1 hypothetical protein MELB17_09963 [Marinobacter sp. ELB17]